MQSAATDSNNLFDRGNIAKFNKDVKFYQTTVCKYCDITFIIKISSYCEINHIRINLKESIHSKRRVTMQLNFLSGKFLNGVKKRERRVGKKTFLF